MKLFKTTVLVNGAISWGINGRIPNLKLGLSKPWSGLNTANKPVTGEENGKPDSESESVANDKWYSLNDGVMGGESSGSAKWYSLNDGVMGGVSTGSGMLKIEFSRLHFKNFKLL